MTNALHLTEAQLSEIVKRLKPRTIKLLGREYEPLPDGDRKPKPPGRPKSPPKNREQFKQDCIAKLAKRWAQREAKREYKTSDGEALLIQQMQLAGITDWVREYRFLPDRLFRLDFSWPKIRLAVEVEGGSWQNGRHSRGTGFRKDAEKYNLLTLAGWRLLRYTPDMLKTGIAVQQITDMLVGLQIGPSNSAQDAREGTETGQGALQRTGKPLPPAGEP